MGCFVGRSNPSVSASRVSVAKGRLHAPDGDSLHRLCNRQEPFRVPAGETRHRQQLFNRTLHNRINLLLSELGFGDRMRGSLSRFSSPGSRVATGGTRSLVGCEQPIDQP